MNMKKTNISMNVADKLIDEDFLNEAAEDYLDDLQLNDAAEAELLLIPDQQAPPSPQLPGEKHVLISTTLITNMMDKWACIMQTPTLTRMKLTCQWISPILGIKSIGSLNLSVGWKLMQQWLARYRIYL